MINLAHISEVSGPKRQTPKYFFSVKVIAVVRKSKFFSIWPEKIQAAAFSLCTRLYHSSLTLSISCSTAYLGRRGGQSGLWNCLSNYGSQTGLFLIFSLWISILGEKESEFILSCSLDCYISKPANYFRWFVTRINYH